MKSILTCICNSYSKKAFLPVFATIITKKKAFLPVFAVIPSVPDYDPRFIYSTGKGYIQYDLERAGIQLRDDFEISTTFATYQKDALLWYMGNEEKNIHLSLQVRVVMSAYNIAHENLG